MEKEQNLQQQSSQITYLCIFTIFHAPGPNDRSLQEISNHHITPSNQLLKGASMVMLLGSPEPPLKFVKGSYGIHECICNTLSVEKEINKWQKISNEQFTIGNDKSCDCKEQQHQFTLLETNSICIGYVGFKLLRLTYWKQLEHQFH